MMWSIAALVIALVISSATGSGIVHWLWPVNLRPHSLAARLALAVALGMGVHACVSFFWLIVAPFPLALVAMDVIVMAAALTCWWVMARHETLVQKSQDENKNPNSDPPQRQSPIAWLLHGAMTLAMSATGLAMYGDAIHRPYGGWDAWFFWNMKARFFFRGGELWARALTEARATTHPDYPLLVPLNLARLWVYIGHDALLAGNVINAMYMLLIIGLLWGAVAWLRSAGAASAAVLTLITSSIFIRSAGSQYADGPLGLYILTACVLVTAMQIHRPAKTGLMLLAGMGAGCAAWTKNEGILFLCVTFGVIIFVDCLEGTKQKIRSRWWPLIMGAAAWMVCLILMKTQLMGETDLIAAQSSAGVAVKITDVNRYVMVANWFLNLHVLLLDPVIMALLFLWGLIGFGSGWQQAGKNSCGGSCAGFRRMVAGVMMLLPMAVLVMMGVAWLTGLPTEPSASGVALHPHFVRIFMLSGVGCSLLLYGLMINEALWRAAMRPGILMIAGVVAGYFMVFVLTPHDLVGHLSSTVDRLLMHLWPSVLLMIFMMLPTPESMLQKNS